MTLFIKNLPTEEFKEPKDSNLKLVSGPSPFNYCHDAWSHCDSFYDSLNGQDIMISFLWLDDEDDNETTFSIDIIETTKYSLEGYKMSTEGYLFDNKKRKEFEAKIKAHQNCIDLIQSALDN